MVAARTLILMRHAAAAGAPRDEDRPITENGELAAADAGDWIRANLPIVDAVLCSVAVRARQTLAALAIDAPAEFIDELYNAGVDEILEQIGLVPDEVQTVLVVGHAPGMPSTAYELATVEGRPETSLIEDLRFFAAGALAVLRSETRWDEFADRGGELVTVRHPDR